MVMDECIYARFRLLVEIVSRYFQEHIIAVHPDRRNEQYRELVTEHFCGTKEPPVFWENLEDAEVGGSWCNHQPQPIALTALVLLPPLLDIHCTAEVLKRLAQSDTEDHEKTAALYINFKNYAGRHYRYWDWCQS